MSVLPRRSVLVVLLLSGLVVQLTTTAVAAAPVVVDCNSAPMNSDFNLPSPGDYLYTCSSSTSVVPHGLVLTASPTANTTSVLTLVVTVPFAYIIIQCGGVVHVTLQQNATLIDRGGTWATLWFLLQPPSTTPLMILDVVADAVNVSLTETSFASMFILSDTATPLVTTTISFINGAVLSIGCRNATFNTCQRKLILTSGNALLDYSWGSLSLVVRNASRVMAVNTTLVFMPAKIPTQLTAARNATVVVDDRSEISVSSAICLSPINADFVSLLISNHSRVTASRGGTVIFIEPPSNTTTRIGVIDVQALSSSTVIANSGIIVFLSSNVVVGNLNVLVQNTTLTLTESSSFIHSIGPNVSCGFDSVILSYQFTTVVIVNNSAAMMLVFCHVGGAVAVESVGSTVIVSATQAHLIASATSIRVTLNGSSSWSSSDVGMVFATSLVSDFSVILAGGSNISLIRQSNFLLTGPSMPVQPTILVSLFDAALIMVQMSSVAFQLSNNNLTSLTLSLSDRSTCLLYNASTLLYSLASVQTATVALSRSATIDVYATSRGFILGRLTSLSMTMALSVNVSVRENSIFCAVPVSQLLVATMSSGCRIDIGASCSLWYVALVVQSLPVDALRPTLHIELYDSTIAVDGGNLLQNQQLWFVALTLRIGNATSIDVSTGGAVFYLRRPSLSSPGIGTPVTTIDVVMDRVLITGSTSGMTMMIVGGLFGAASLYGPEVTINQTNVNTTLVSNAAFVKVFVDGVSKYLWTASRCTFLLQSSIIHQPFYVAKQLTCNLTDVSIQGIPPSPESSGVISDNVVVYVANTVGAALIGNIRCNMSLLPGYFLSLQATLAASTFTTTETTIDIEEVDSVFQSANGTTTAFLYSNAPIDILRCWQRGGRIVLTGSLPWAFIVPNAIGIRLLRIEHEHMSLLVLLSSAFLKTSRTVSFVEYNLIGQSNVTVIDSAQLLLLSDVGSLTMLLSDSTNVTLRNVAYGVFIQTGLATAVNVTCSDGVVLNSVANSALLMTNPSYSSTSTLLPPRLMITMRRTTAKVAGSMIFCLKLKFSAVTVVHEDSVNLWLAEQNVAYLVALDTIGDILVRDSSRGTSSIQNTATSTGFFSLYAVTNSSTFEFSNETSVVCSNGIFVLILLASPLATNGAEEGVSLWFTFRNTSLHFSALNSLVALSSPAANITVLSLQVVSSNVTIIGSTELAGSVGDKGGWFTMFPAIVGTVSVLFEGTRLVATNTTNVIRLQPIYSPLTLIVFTIKQCSLSLTYGSTMFTFIDASAMSVRSFQLVHISGDALLQSTPESLLTISHGSTFIVFNGQAATLSTVTRGVAVTIDNQSRWGTFMNYTLALDVNSNIITAWEFLVDHCTITLQHDSRWHVWDKSILESFPDVIPDRLSIRFVSQYSNWFTFTRSQWLAVSRTIKNRVDVELVQTSVVLQNDGSVATTMTSAAITALLVINTTAPWMTARLACNDSAIAIIGGGGNNYGVVVATLMFVQITDDQPVGPTPASSPTNTSLVSVTLEGIRSTVSCSGGMGSLVTLGSNLPSINQSSLMSIQSFVGANDKEEPPSLGTDPTTTTAAEGTHPPIQVRFKSCFFDLQAESVVLLRLTAAPPPSPASPAIVFVDLRRSLINLTSRWQGGNSGGAMPWLTRNMSTVLSMMRTTLVLPTTPQRSSSVPRMKNVTHDDSNITVILYGCSKNTLQRYVAADASSSTGGSSSPIDAPLLYALGATSVLVESCTNAFTATMTQGGSSRSAELTETPLPPPAALNPPIGRATTVPVAATIGVSALGSMLSSIPGIGVGVMRGSMWQRVVAACGAPASSDNNNDGGDEDDNTIGPDDFLRVGGGLYYGGVASNVIALGVVCVVVCILICIVFVIQNRYPPSPRSRRNHRHRSHQRRTWAHACRSLALPGWIIAGPHSVVAPVLLSDGLLLAATTNSSAESNVGGHIALGVFALVVCIAPILLAVASLTRQFDAQWSEEIIRRRGTTASWLLYCAGHWEARREMDTEDNGGRGDSPSIASARFIEHYEPLFGGCRKGWRAYFLVETGFSMAASLVVIVAGLTAGTNGGGGACDVAAPLLCAIQIVAFMSVVAARPYSVRYEQCLASILALVGAIGSILVVVDVDSATLDALGTAQLVIAAILPLCSLRARWLLYRAGVVLHPLFPQSLIKSHNHSSSSDRRDDSNRDRKKRGILQFHLQHRRRGPQGGDTNELEPHVTSIEDILAQAPTSHVTYRSNKDDRYRRIAALHGLVTLICKGKLQAKTTMTTRKREGP